MFLGVARHLAAGLLLLVVGARLVGLFVCGCVDVGVDDDNWHKHESLTAAANSKKRYKGRRVEDVAGRLHALH
jgi:hypothetical protein